MNRHNFVALGGDCYTRMLLNKLEKKEETQLFDYIGTSMWGINDMLENNFAELLNKKHYSMQTVIDKQIPVQHLYNLRFMHDGSIIKNTEINPEFMSRMERRVERMKTLLTTTKNLIFIRAQERADRLWVPKEYPKDEMPEIHRFLHLLRDKFGVETCQFVYINRDYEGVHDGIICIKTTRVAGPLDSVRPSLLAAISHLPPAK